MWVDVTSFILYSNISTFVLFFRHSMEQMFEVVSDVENYHKFVPWCKKSVVLLKTPSRLKADLIVGFPPINESYTSNVTLVKPHLVKAECLDGKLFHHLLTVWRFSPGLKREQRSCVVDFQITFEFRSAFHSHLSNLFFDQVARQMEGAFIREVGKRFGPATMQPRNMLVNNQAIKSWQIFVTSSQILYFNLMHVTLV